MRWTLLLVAAVLLWILEYRQEMNDIRAEFSLPEITLFTKRKDGENMRKSQPVNKFFCLEKDKGECVKNMIGEPECEFCQHYLVCTKCGHFDTTYCDGCMIAALNQSFDMSD